MHIAIVKLSALGDIIHAMVALQFIKQHVPDIEIDWIVEERFAGILHNNPDISQILTVNLKALKNNKLAIFQEIKKIRQYAKNHYDLVIDAQGLIKSAITARLLGKRVAGFDQNSIREKAASWFYDVKVACAYDENTIDRNALVLSAPLGFGITSTDILGKKPFLYTDNANPELGALFPKNRNTVVFVTGSTWESRNYPPEKFVKIAQNLSVPCLTLWGNEQEKIKADWMSSQCANIKVMPKLDLNDLKAVIARTDLVIGNDTGPTHMAWALNKPSITVFGPTPISRVYQTDINKVIKSHSTVNPYKLNREDYSIRDIDEHEIIELAKHLLPNRTH
ncbi:lipopolysaccharide heptosyltransferase I [Methyloglobulus sp.]|uniref:lipopolysaccharide heptosyltransferase I n=1 Tax=Methyloglobulus sp. TaxID=2518622 RepID=UPI0017F36146|nr:lipopolysaccharide heptosyltransferase I [Methyloglobulus sp.]